MGGQEIKSLKIPGFRMSWEGAADLSWHSELTPGFGEVLKAKLRLWEGSFLIHWGRWETNGKERLEKGD